MLKNIWDNSTTICLLVLSSLALIYFYNNLNKIEAPNRGFIDRIPAYDTSYLLQYHNKNIGYLNTSFQNGIIKVFKLDFKLSDLSYELIENKDTITKAELLLLTNPIDQIVSIRINLSSANRNNINIISKNISPIEFEVTGMYSNRTFSILGPYYLKSNGDKTYRLKLPDTEEYSALNIKYENILKDIVLEPINSDNNQIESVIKLDVLSAFLDEINTKLSK